MKPVGRGHRGPEGIPTTEEEPMGIGDKMKNAADQVKGKAKEKTGDATDDKDLQAEGKADESIADLKQAGEKAKDAFRD
jgi:uncharacterized protein YjbJ (UPF0337 family)